MGNVRARVWVLAQVVAGAGAGAGLHYARVRCGTTGEGREVATRWAALLEREQSGTAGWQHYWKGSGLALRKGRKLTRLIGVRACGRMHAVTACSVVACCGVVT